MQPSQSSSREIIAQKVAENSETYAGKNCDELVEVIRELLIDVKTRLLDENVTEIKTLKERIAELESYFDTKRQEHSAKLSDNKYDDELDALLCHDTPDALKRKLETANSQLAATTEKLKSETAKTGRLEQQIGQLRGDLEAIYKELTNLGEMVAERDELTKKITIKLKDAVKQIEVLEKEKIAMQATHQETVKKLLERDKDTEKLNADLTHLQQQNAQLLDHAKDQKRSDATLNAEMQEAKKKCETLAQQLEAKNEQDSTVSKTRAPLVRTVYGPQIYVRYNGIDYRVSPSAKSPGEVVETLSALPNGQPYVDMAELDDVVLLNCAPYHLPVVYAVMGVKGLLGGWSLLCRKLLYDARRELFGMRYCHYKNGCSRYAEDPSQGPEATTAIHPENCERLLSSAKFNLLDWSVSKPLQQLMCRTPDNFRHDTRLEYDSTHEVALVKVPPGQHSAIANNIVYELAQGQCYYVNQVQKLRFNSGLDADSWRPSADPDVEEVKTKLPDAEKVALTVWDRSMAATKLLFLWRSDDQTLSGSGYMTLAYEIDGGASTGWRHTSVYADYGQADERSNTKPPEFLWYTDNDDDRSCRKLPMSDALIRYCGRCAKKKAMPGTQNN